MHMKGFSPVCTLGEVVWMMMVSGGDRDGGDGGVAAVVETHERRRLRRCY